MLTSANVSSEMAINYFIKNYYHQGKSRWSGKAAEKLGLSGAIEDEQAFKNVIEGRSPDGREQLNARVMQHKERRAAIDCTFSVPKSVSLMALVGGDTRLIDAHHQALEKTIQLMEERYATTRVIEGDKRHRVNTNNLLVAQFDHIESRDLDPHLHTHCLVMNTTQTANGKWYSLVNSEIYANKKFLGMAYQNYLAREVMKLGYEIEPKLHGQFEIKGFKEQDLQVFSKRRQQIIAKCGVNSDWAQREKVWDKTRQRKQKVTQEELVALWKQEAHKLGIGFVQPQQPKPDVDTEKVNQKDLNSFLEDAIAHCSERNVAFRFEDVAKFILNERLATDVTQIEPLLKQHPQIIALEGLEQYTTIGAVEREIATIELMEKGKQKVNPIFHPEVIESQLGKTLLNQGQRQAVEMALTACDRFVAWQGVAGAGKTFALKELKRIAVEAGYTVKGFAPSSMAAKVLSEELGIQGETVARLLVSEAPPEPQANQVWIVDEAGLLSAKDAHALLEKATAQGARLLLVGDTKQLSSVGAGNPFKSLQQAGIQTAHLTQSNRQRNPHLKIAVDLIAQGRIEAGFQQLDSIGSIAEVSPESKLETIASEYMALTPSQRERTLVLAGTNAEKLALTQAIRSKLKTEGSLGATTNITQLTAKNLTSVQMRYTHNYELGEFVMPTRNYKRRGLEKGQLYEVIDKDTDQLTVQAPDGTTLKLNIGFEGAVYQCNQIEIAVGDRLQWKKNDRTLQRRNGQEFVVTAINGDTADIKYNESERTETINLKQAHNLDYALVTTTYSSQGKTAETALISADYTIDQQSFYVAVSRAKDSVKIFTEDKQYLLELAQKSKAKENALELLRQQVKQEKASFKNEVSLSKEPVVAASTVTVEKPITKRSTPQGLSVASVAVEKPILKKRIPTQAFWTPAIEEPAPNHIDPKHWQELVENSAIHPQIAALNFESLHFGYVGGEHEAWNRLMISDKLKRTNTGGLTKGFLELYSHIDAGGWWCNSGVDSRSFASLAPGAKPATKEWGCYKPNQPRPKKDDDGQVIPGKFIKYEHPPKVELSLFLLDVPDEIAQRIYALHKINPNNSDRTSGFWYCVWKHNLPITITEGAKKAASLLSQGHVAIGLPGISAGYRSPKDEFGQKIGKSYLAPELAVFATPKREIKFCFDYETKPETKLNIKRDISTTGWLLHKQGCSVKVITLPGPDKGVDDFFVAQGALAYETVSHEAVSLRDWQYHNRQQSQKTYQPPRKLTPEENQHKLATSQNFSPLSPTKEPDRDNHQQPQQSTTRTNSTPHREDRSTSHQNRATPDAQSAVESENRAVVNEPNREFERVAIGTDSVLGETSRITQPTTIEQSQANFRELNRSHTPSQLRGERTAHIRANTLQSNTASVDSPTSDVNLRSNIHERVINAIANFLEIKQIARAINVEQLQTLIDNLHSYQYTAHQVNTTPQTVIAKEQVLTDVANQNCHAQLALAQGAGVSSMGSREQGARGSLCASLSPLPPVPCSFASSWQKAIDAITNFVEQKAVSSTLAQVLPSITEQLVLYQEELTTENKALNELEQKLKQQLASAKAIDAITNFVEQKAVSSTLAEVLPSITEQLSFYQKELVTENKAINNLEQKFKGQLASAKAIDAITQHVQLREIESSQVVKKLAEVVEQLKQLYGVQSHVKTSAPDPTQKAINEIANFVEQKQISSALSEVLPSLTKEISEYQQQLVCENQIIQSLQQTLVEKLVTTEATKAIVNSVEEKETNQEATEQFNSQTPVIAPELVQQSLDAIANFVEQRQISVALAEVVPSLTKEITEYQQQLASQNQIFKVLEEVQLQTTVSDKSSKEEQKYREQIELLNYQDFYNLVMYVKSYFEKHSETEDNPQTRALLIVRSILREMKAEAIKNQQQEPKFKL